MSVFNFRLRNVLNELNNDTRPDTNISQARARSYKKIVAENLSPCTFTQGKLTCRISIRNVLNELNNDTRPDTMTELECRYPHYESKDSRLKSYKHWPPSLQPGPKELAEAGFFYTGIGDRTQCFFCGGGLKAWMPGASPWEQHARWYDCAFVLQEKGEDYVRRVIKHWWGEREEKFVSTPLAKNQEV